MSTAPPTARAIARAQTRSEELANSLSHGLACLAALAAIPFLFTAVRPALPSPSTVQQIGIGVFAVTMVVVYLASALYHGLPDGRAKRLFMRVDHCAIFLFIAGTYTPFTVKILNDPWGWPLLTGVWTMAIAGLIAKSLGLLDRPLVSTLLYIALGWVAVLVAGPVLAAIPGPGAGWLYAGGVAYTVGAIFYSLDGHIKFGHLVWHLFAIGGTVCHYLAVWRYV
ncbi:hemolysin III [Pandoraea captiosa]|uniref:Hemolysin III n=1 Tax=Pandoraea captiosa TaxID=2508302 RepID=A0A5E4ZL54_9BURK|nr:hemolysin III family protein [Pandoraea captiosa]VVE61568.1 hemolysin III [Pandoraea captiosa]